MRITPEGYYLTKKEYESAILKVVDTSQHEVYFIPVTRKNLNSKQAPKTTNVRELITRDITLNELLKLTSTTSYYFNKLLIKEFGTSSLKAVKKIMFDGPMKIPEPIAPSEPVAPVAPVVYSPTELRATVMPVVCSQQN